MPNYRNASPERRATIQNQVSEYLPAPSPRFDTGYDLPSQPLLEWLESLDDNTFQITATALSREIQENLVCNPAISANKQRIVTEVTSHLTVVASSPHTPQDVLEYIMTEYDDEWRWRVVTYAAYNVEDEAAIIYAAWLRRGLRDLLLNVLAERDLDSGDTELGRTYQLSRAAHRLSSWADVCEEDTYPLAAALVESSRHPEYGRYWELFLKMMEEAATRWTVADPDTLSRLAEWFWAASDNERLLASRITNIVDSVETLIDDVEAVAG